MELTVLAVAECPTAAVLHERLAVALAGHTGTSMTWHEITDEQQAAELGMHGSPTLLINGVDPFLREGETTRLSCRIFHDPQQNPGGTPSVARLREALRNAPTPAGRVAVIVDRAVGPCSIRRTGRPGAMQ
jgi:hypothetical protein